MKSLTNWQIIIIIGIIVIILGVSIPAMGIERKQNFAIDEAVDPAIIYSYEMEISENSLLHFSYNLTEGNMTTAIVNQANYEELISTGNLSSVGAYNLSIGVYLGEINWISDEKGTYHAIFYLFSEQNATLKVDGTYHGEDSRMLYAGIITIIAGLLILLLGIIKRRELKKAIVESTEEIDGEAVPDSSSTM